LARRWKALAHQPVGKTVQGQKVVQTSDGGAPKSAWDQIDAQTDKKIKAPDGKARGPEDLLGGAGRKQKDRRFGNGLQHGG